MIKTINDYELLHCIATDGIISFYHARCRINKTLCILKLPASESFPEPASSFLKNEYAICSKTALEQIVKSNRIILLNNSCFIEYQNREVIPLALNLGYGMPLPDEFYATAINLSEIVAKLHDSGIVHRNLSPFSFLKSITSSAHFLTGFYVATMPDGSSDGKSAPLYYPPGCSYIAPEQTGNIERPIDERTDLYALGAVFYEMLSGEPPFVDSDPSSLMYSHVAREPVPLIMKKKDVPRPLSDIIRKLLEKNPADRYQSAQGVLADLEECRSLVKKGNISQVFFPGAKDRITRLLPLETLYGRNKQLKELKDIFLTSDKGHSSCVLISGQAGVGKTRLFNAFRESIARPDVLVAHGKCEATSTTVPYHALKTALVDLIRGILAQGNEAVAHWRELLLGAIGYNREIIAEFIPEIQMIIGPCRHRKITDDVAAVTQFKNVFIRFIQCFLQKDSTFVLFIDDLQWADSALNNILLPAFFESTDRKFLFVGAGRNDFDDSNPIIKAIMQSGVSVNRIELKTLSLKNTKQMITGALGHYDDDLNGLETIIFNKTDGNPLFLKEFLEMLVSRRLLVHQFVQAENAPPNSPHSLHWKWDGEKILRLECTENVVDIIIDKAHMLPQHTQHILRIASCIGMQFDCTLLGIIENAAASTIAETLKDAIDVGILSHSASGNGSGLPLQMRFIHDRIREAIYNRIDPAERTRLHLLIGRALLSLKKSGNDDVAVFDIVNHFNPFRPMVTDQGERYELARLNTNAAHQSRNANACEIAIDYLNAAIAFLPATAWETDQPVRFEIELSMAECEYLLSRLDGALHRLSLLSGCAVNQLQLAAVDLVRMSIFDHQQATPLSMEVGFNRLRAMGITLPVRPSVMYLIGNVLRAAMAMRTITRSKGRQRGESTAVPEDQSLTFRILSRIWLQAVSLDDFRIVVSIATYLIRCTRTYGECGAASVAICFWGILTGRLTGNPLKGLHYGNMALSIARRFDDMFSRGITFFLYGSYFAYLQGHLNNAQEILAEGRRISYEAGDTVSVSNSTEGHLLFQALSGKSLQEVQRSALESIRFLEHVGIPEKGLIVIKFIHSWAENMENELVIDGPSAIADAGREVPLVKGIFLLFSMFAFTLAGEWKTALLLAKALKGSPLLDPTSYFHSFFTFIHALAVSASYDEMPRRQYIHLLKRQLSVLKKASVRSTVNIRHLFLFITAEYCRINNKNWEAIQFYRQAIEAARSQGFIHHAAMAAERAALFLKPFDSEDYRNLLKTAMSLYHEWGSQAKVRKLQRDAPDVSFNPLNQALLPGFTEIDVQALLKSFEAISNELILDRLLEKLIRIVMENVGAQRGVLLLEQHGTFFVRVEGVLSFSDADSSSWIESHAVETASEQFPIPQGIISYVQRSREPVRLEHALERGRFVHDPYIKKHAIKSVLCVPLEKNELVRGIIYLENNTAEAAFPPARLQLLRLLCGQAIISIENALFHDIEIKHLQSKVNPHFIFNALSSVAELCHTDPDATEDAIIKLSTLYRYVLTSEMHLVTLEEELEIVHKYLAIEKLRFGNRLTYEVHINGDPSLVRMPSMLIQPLVENSIKHGISPRPSGGTITIVIAITDKQCDVTVEDDGVGPNHSSPGSGYGLESIRKRLALQYRNAPVFEINDTAGFKVHFSVPLVPEGDEVLTRGHRDMETEKQGV